MERCAFLRYSIYNFVFYCTTITTLVGVTRRLKNSTHLESRLGFMTGNVLISLIIQMFSFSFLSSLSRCAKQLGLVRISEFVVCQESSDSSETK